MITAKIFWQLLKTDLRIFFKRRFWENFINLVIWAACVIFINAHVLQKLGLQQNYGELMIAGVMVSAAWFQMIPHIFNNVADFFGERHIDYHLTLPLSNYFIFIKSACFYFINILIFSLIGLFLSKVMLLDKMTLSKISSFHFFISLTFTTIFFSFFTLFLISICKHPGDIGNIISRIIFPLWYAGFGVPWRTLYDTLPILGVISLLNPFTYMTETLRVATIGQQNFLPFWPSSLALIVITLITGYVGILKIKKKLDFI